MSPYVVAQLPEWTMMDIKMGMTAMVQEHETTDDHSMNRPYSAFVLGIPLQRRFEYHLWNSGLSLFLLQIANFAVFATNPVAIDARLGYLITLMLTATALKYSMSETVPSVSYLTLADKFSVFTIILHTVTLVFVVGVATIGKDDDTADTGDTIELLWKLVKEDGLTRNVEVVDETAFSLLFVSWCMALAYFLFSARWNYMDGQAVLAGKHQTTEFDGPWWKLKFCCTRRFWWCFYKTRSSSKIKYNEDGLPWHLDQAFYAGKKQGIDLSKNTYLSFYHSELDEIMQGIEETKSWRVPEEDRNSRQLLRDSKAGRLPVLQRQWSHPSPRRHLPNGQ
eukprot:g791.t1